MKMQLTVIFQSNLSTICEYAIILNTTLQLFMPTAYTKLLSINKSASLAGKTQWTPSTRACNPYPKFGWRRPCNLFICYWRVSASISYLKSIQGNPRTAWVVKSKHQDYTKYWRYLLML